MNANTKKFIRTIQTNFPFLLDLKFGAMRQYRRWRRRPFEAEFEALALFPDSPDELFLDVGANRGQSTEAVMMKTRMLRIHQFEPNPSLCEKLVRLYGGNERITTNNFGLGDVATEQVLYIPYYKKWAFDGLASFEPDSAEEWLKDRIFHFDKRRLTLREARCRIRRLDELGLSPSFIKLDIQGYEFQALQGGDQTLRRCEPVLLIESPPEERIVKYLDGLGYEMYRFADGQFIRGMVGRRNTFFMTPKRAQLIEKHLKT